MVFSTLANLRIGDEIRIPSWSSQDLFYSLTQACAWLFFSVGARLFFDIQISGRENFYSAPKPLIIVANHISFLDPFLLNIAINFPLKYKPLRFMAVRKFKWPVLNFLKKIFLIDFIYNFFGAFTIVPGLGLEKNLEKPKKILLSGGMIVIYPEGTIVQGDEIMPFRRGAAVLSLTTGVGVLPISFRKGSRGLFRKKLYVNIGHIIKPFGFSEEVLTSKLHRSVEELYIRSTHNWIYENNEI